MADVNVDDEVTEGGFEDSRGGFQGGKGGRKPGAIAFIVFVGLISTSLVGVAAYNVLHHKHVEKEEKQEPVNSLPQMHFSHTVEPRPDDMPAAPAMAHPAMGPVPAQDRLGGYTPSGDSRPGHGKKKEKTPEELAMDRRLGHDFDHTNEIGSSPSSKGDQPQAEEASEASGGLNSSLHAKYDAPAMASVLRHPDLLITRGTMIACGTKEEINTTQPGMISCQVSRDVWSVNGKVRLIDKGAFVDGQVAQGVKFGQNRVFVVWTRVRNPDNTIINLSSPGTGPLGAPGLEGSLNNHWWERFGDAIMISIITDLGQTLVQSVSNLASKEGTTSINTSNTESSSQQMGREALMAKVNIPPTLYKQQGDAISIYVARDLDFSNVYRLTDE